MLIGDPLKLDATPLAAELAERLLRLRSVAQDLRVYVEFDLSGRIPIGRASYLVATLRWMGLVNVYDHEPRAYFVPDLREVLDLRPDLIVYKAVGFSRRSRRRHAGRAWLGRRTGLHHTGRLPGP